MKNRKFNKDKLITFIFILVGIILLGVVGYKVYNDFFKNNDTKVLAHLELYGYTLDEDDNILYKNKFKELETILNKDEIDYKSYAEVLGSLYIIDFYTLTNKISSTDVGAIEFIHPDSVDNFKLKARDTMYKYIEVNYDGKRSQKLPEVSEVVLENSEKSTYTLREKEYESYELKYSWKYKVDLGYETSSTLTVAKDGSKLYVVRSDNE